jgi:hypothetical protein
LLVRETTIDLVVIFRDCVDVILDRLEAFYWSRITLRVVEIVLILGILDASEGMKFAELALELS